VNALKQLNMLYGNVHLLYSYGLLLRVSCSDHSGLQSSLGWLATPREAETIITASRTTYHVNACHQACMAVEERTSIPK